MLRPVACAGPSPSLHVPLDLAPGYIRTFLLKTTYSEPRAITFQSLVEAVGPYRELMGGQAAAAGGAAGEAGAGAGAGAEGSDKKAGGGQAGPVGGASAKAAKPVASSS